VKRKMREEVLTSRHMHSEGGGTSGKGKKRREEEKKDRQQLEEGRRKRSSRHAQRERLWNKGGEAWTCPSSWCGKKRDGSFKEKKRQINSGKREKKRGGRIGTSSLGQRKKGKWGKDALYYLLR